MQQMIDMKLNSIVAKGKSLGFDLLEAAFVKQQLLGIRVANSAVCRENLLQERSELHLTGSWQQRSGRKVLPWNSESDYDAAIQDLKGELEAGVADPEYILPGQGSVAIGDGVGLDTLMDKVNLVEVYSAIASGIEKVGARGLRLTGYLEIQIQDVIKFSTSGLTENHCDGGGQASFTVDDPGSGLSGVGKRAVGFKNLSEIGLALQHAIDEAMRFGGLHLPKREIEPGDYDVILTPSAVFDILRTKLFYGFWDRRKIDEGRTYLSKHPEMKFDPGLILKIDPSTPEQSGLAADPGFNSRGTACHPLELIKNGRVQDTFTSPYWATQTGGSETFEPHFLPPLQLELDPDSQRSKIKKFSNLEDLIADTERGLLVVDTWYLRLVAEMEGIITGMTRDGLFLIENGRIVAPLSHLRWHENPFGVLQRIDAMTTDLHLCGLPRRAGQARGSSALLPAIRVRDFHFSSATKF